MAYKIILNGVEFFLLSKYENRINIIKENEGIHKIFMLSYRSLDEKENSSRKSEKSTRVIIFFVFLSTT
jgi:hypothetical protein